MRHGSCARCFAGRMWESAKQAGLRNNCPTGNSSECSNSAALLPLHDSFPHRKPLHSMQAGMRSFAGRDQVKGDLYGLASFQAKRDTDRA